MIRKMVRDLDVPVEIAGCPTVREPDGLAMSSRNAYLEADDRRAATVLYRALAAAQDRWAQGERSAGALRSATRAVLDAEPRARTEYVSVADPATLRELDEARGPAIISMAVVLGRSRLIDNLVLEP